MQSAQALDPSIVNLARAIRDVESGGQPDPFRAKGDSGEHGAYQFMPATWGKVAPQYGVNTALEMASPEEQNKVAYHYIESLKKQGYNAGQIASIWNSGRADPSGRVGTNSAGVNYNTPQYVENVYNKYTYYKNSGAPMDVDGRPAQKVNELPQYHAMFPNQKDDSVPTSVAKAVGNVVPSAVGLVKDIASLVFHPIQTIQNISGIAVGGLESLDDELQTENTEKFDLFVQAMKDRYGSMEALENTAVNDPFGMGADILGLLYGGAGLAGKAGTVTKGVDLVGGAAMSPVRAAGRGVAAPFGRSVDVATETAAGRLGMEAAELPASARSTSRVVPLAEALAGKTFGGSEIAARQSAAATRLKEIADEVVTAANGAEDLVVAGERLAKGIEAYGKKFKDEMNKLYGDFEAKRGDTLAQTGNAVRILEDILSRKEAIGDVEGARFFKSKFDVLTGVKKKGQKRREAPTYTTLKEMRTDLGERVKGFGDMFVTANKAQLKQLYGALSSDMRATIKSTRNSKKLLEELDAVNAAYKAGRAQLDSSFIDQILRFGKSKQFDKILPALLRPSTSINDIKTIMAITGEAGTAEIRGALLRSVFDKAAGAEGFKPATIIKELEKNGAKWKQILAPEQYQALEDLGQVSAALGRSKKISEGSQTAYTVAQLGQFGMMGWSFIDLLSGNLAGFAQKWALLGMGYGAAKVIASPFGQRLLTTGILKRAQVQAAVAQQGLTPPTDGGMLAGYGNDGNLVDDVARGASRVSDGRPKTGEGGGGSGASEALKASLSPIIERAKARSGLDFNIEDIQMTGSRSAGKGTKKSDMDVVVQISGSADEAAVLAALRRGRTKVDGAKVDYTVTKEPIGDFRKKTEDPEKYEAPLTSEFVPDTKAGRLEASFKKYLENIGMGLSMKDVGAGGQRFDIGLTSVKGKTAGAMDDLVTEADELYAAGKYDEAAKKYNDALAGGIETLTKAFEGTGIKVKPRGVGFGVYGGLEPNYDLAAIVPKGKEDLFHYILADIADRDFHQHSMLTYRQAPADSLYGVVDEARGISIEPQLRFNLEKELSAKDVGELQKIAEESGLAGLSLREGGKTIDIINITKYSDDYEGFKKGLAKFESNLAGRGISGIPEYRKAEVRFIGNDPQSSHGFASYKSVRDQFRAQNPDFFNSDEGVTSRIIERIKNRQSVSPLEVEQLTKMQDITPMERGVVLSALDDLKGVKKIPTKDLVARIEGKSLPVSMYETDSYANYGIDNVGLDYMPSKGEAPKTLVFETPIVHGNSGHFSNPKHFGHTRVLITDEGGKKVGYIVEMQSDVAQKTDLGAKMVDDAQVRRDSRAEYEKANTEEIDRLNAEETRLEEEIRKVRSRQQVDSKYVADEEALMEQRSAVRERMSQMNDEVGKAGDEAVAKAIQGLDLPQKQLITLLKDRNKYQDVMLRGTLQYFEKNGVQEVRVATPSSAAKIEGFVGGGEGTAPYTRWNGDPYAQDDVVRVGDELDYAGERWIALNDNDSFDAAPADAVRQFRWDEYVEDDIQNAWDDAKYELDKYLNKKGELTPEKAAEAEEKGLDFHLERAIGDLEEGNKTVSDIEERFKARYEADTDFESRLNEIYGEGKVFINQRRIASKVYRNEEVYVVEHDANTELFEQPDRYDAFDGGNITAIDEDPKLTPQHFSDTQRTVLENYSDLRSGALKRLEKTENVQVDYFQGDGGTWYTFPMTRVKRYLFGA